MDTASTPEWASGATSIPTKSAQDEESAPAFQNRNTVLTSVSFAPSMSANNGMDNMEMTSLNEPQLSPSTRRTFAHRAYRFFKFIAIALAFLLLLAQVLSLVFLPFDAHELVLKVFLGSFSILIMLNELEWWGLLKNSPILWNWIPRGYFYAFIGLVSVEENEVKSDMPLNSIVGSYSAAMFIETVSWMIFAVGVLYSVFGLCCGQLYVNKVRDNYSERLAERKRIFEEGLNSDTAAVSKQLMMD